MTDRRRNLLILLLVAGALIASAIVIAVKPTREGLDLKGGVELVYQAKPTKQSQVTGDAIQRSLDIMRERVDQLGVAEPEIQRSGSDQIVVSLPAVKNQQAAIQQVGTVAQLYFYDWETNVLGPGCKPDPTNANVTGGESAGAPGAGTLTHYDAIVRASRCPANELKTSSHDRPQYFIVDDTTKAVLAGPQDTRGDALTQAKLKALGSGQSFRVVQPGTVLVRAEDDNAKDKKKPDAWYVLRDDVALGGKDIKNPKQASDQNDQPTVTFDFTSKGRKTWQTVTRSIAQRGQSQFAGGDARSAFQHFAIVLDQDLISAPYIDFQQNPDGIDGRSGSEISGGFTISSAQRLAELLKTGALPIKLQLISSSQVSATLGQQALHQGLIAGLVGFVVVALFLLAFYRMLGVIAVGGLVVYGAYLFGLIKLIPITLTLPGIAGLILTIGVAADANIVIFERVKEEVRAGRSIGAAITQGYKRGIAAIVDANVVTFLTAFVLFILATAGVKGFALVLGIGTITSLFTAVLATQAVLATLGRSKLMASPSALGAGSSKRRISFDFMGSSRWFFSMSGVILLVGALAVGGKGLNLGIDFKSGTRITASFKKATNETAIRDVLSPLGLGDAKIQKVSKKGVGGNGFQITTHALANAKLVSAKAALDKKLGFAREQDQTVGPTFGNTVAKSAVIAIIISLLVISAWIALRFEWKFAVPVLIGLMHDVLITGGVYSLTGREVTTSTVAALLTILGYSLYDTIIVFDRIRENVPRMPRAAFSQIVNRSMSEVVVRSIATTASTLLPVLALLLFGGETLRDFAFALLVGIASGAYSSIFIASPVLMHWKEREPVYFARRRRIAAQNGGLVPAYASGGAAVDVAPRERKRRTRRLTEPELPGQQVSPSEFQEMVRDLDATAPPVAVEDPPIEPVEPVELDPTRDLSPDEVVMPREPKREKRKGPRRGRSGRKR